MSTRTAGKHRVRTLDIYFLFPTAVVLLLLIGLPLVYVFFNGLTNAKLFSQSVKFVGLQNYINLSLDPRFWNSVQVTLILTTGTVSIQMLLGLGLALLMHHSHKIIRAFRPVFLVPMVLPPVVAGIIWRMLFYPIMPGVNYLLSLVGIHGPHWFGKPLTAQWTVITATAWQWTPFVMLLLLAGLQTLPRGPYESALIDGASRWQMFRFVTIPLLKPIIIFALIYRTIEALKVFPIIYVMTAGGPGTATEPMNYYVWILAFSSYKIGYASSVMIIVVLIVFSIATLLLIYGRRTGAIK